jgi:hypothetical protein
VVFCPRCGTVGTAEARFCARCGQTLEGDEALTVAPDPPTIAPPSHPDRRPSSSSSGWLTSSDSISHGRFAPGAILDGRYRILSLLGRGGMGEVYRADDLRLGQPVALKFLPDAVAKDAVRLAQFHNEVRTARQVSHPNICRVYDIGEAEGQLFLSMEFVDGEDLASSLRRIGRFPEDKATEIARQLCAGLAAAHERGVLHRDLKPANVMLDDAGKVRLMDFGLATIGAVEDVRAGTPAYMAPEQLLGREVTQKSDIYALGLVLYELFTGRRAFTATTLKELVEQHQGGDLTPPRAIVTTLDPAIDRAILRTLDPDPARRPGSALAVAAAFPGGDPLAAALASGETPSPEMVAAAGEGAGLVRRIAIPVFLAALLGIAASYVLALRTQPLERMRPELTAEVLAQKARDAIRQLGYDARPVDEQYGFAWDEALIDHIGDGEGPPQWDAVVSTRPSPLIFQYRRSQSPMIGVQFHHDLLTPGIVTMDDPAPIESGMIQMTLDHAGRLIAFEAIPPQRDESPPASAASPDWAPLLALAGLDQSALEPAAPQWHWLAASDTRIAWTGAWPGSGRALRVEAAALNGRPVAFQTIGPWTRPWRTAEPSTGQEIAVVTVIFLLALAVLVGAGILARKNLREGRGDLRGAQSLGSGVAVLLWILWLCQVHVSASAGLLGIFLLAVCTVVFYAVLFWALYMALEPLVRRHWPQTLVSWTLLLSGRVRDQVVGRDVLVGVLLGVMTGLLIRSVELANGGMLWLPTELLNGSRSTAGLLVMTVLYAIRTALFFVFLLFLLRLLLKNQWVAAAAFALIFAILDFLEALTGAQPMVDAVLTILIFSVFAFAVLRWGLTTLAVGVMVTELLLMLPATADPAAWYVGPAVLVLAIPVALATWAFVTTVRSCVPRARVS